MEKTFANGVPVGPDTDKKTCVNVACTPTLRDKMKHEAQKHDMTMSAFVRALFNEYQNQRLTGGNIECR